MSYTHHSLMKVEKLSWEALFHRSWLIAQYSVIIFKTWLEQSLPKSKRDHEKLIGGFVAKPRRGSNPFNPLSLDRIQSYGPNLTV